MINVDEFLQLVELKNDDLKEISAMCNEFLSIFANSEHENSERMYDLFRNMQIIADEMQLVDGIQMMTNFNYTKSLICTENEFMSADLSLYISTQYESMVKKDPEYPKKKIFVTCST